MAKKNIRTKYIKSLMEDKANLSNVLEQSTKESLDALLEEKVNRSLRQMLAEADDSYQEEEVDPEESEFDTETEETDTNTEDLDDVEDTTEDDVEDVDLEGGDEDATGNEVWDDVEDTLDDDGEYDLRGKDINTVMQILQQMSPEDGIRIIKNDDSTATIEPENGDEEITIDIENADDDEPNDFEDDITTDEDGDSIDIDDTSDDSDDESEDVDEFEFEFDDEDDDEDDDDIEDDDDEDDFNFDFDVDDEDDDEDDDDIEDDDELMNEGQVNIGYTTKYQKQTAMTMPSDKGEGEGDSRFDDGAPKGGSNNGRRWVGSNGANGGNPYTNKTKQPLTEDDDIIYEVVINDNTLDEMKRVASKGGSYEGETEAGRAPGASTATGRRTVKKRLYNTSNLSESRMIDINNRANEILAENKELRAIAEQIKEKLNEAVIINSSLAKVIKLVTENSTTREEKMYILNRFNKVKSLNESTNLYNQISNELKNSHAVNSSKLINNQLTEVQSKNNNMIVETNMLNTSSDLKQILDLQERLMNI